MDMGSRVYILREQTRVLVCSNVKPGMCHEKHNKRQNDTQYGGSECELNGFTSGELFFN